MADENELFAEWLRTVREHRQDVELRLFAAIKKHVHAVVWKMSQEERADLVHDITAAAMIELPDFRQECKFSTWVQEIAHRKVIEERRKLARERKVFDRTKEVVADPQDLEPGESRGNQVVPIEIPEPEDSIALQQVLEKLSEREAALLRYKGDGLKSIEIGKKMGLGLEAVDSRWARLRSKIKKKFTPKRRK